MIKKTRLLKKNGSLLSESSFGPKRSISLKLYSSLGIRLGFRSKFRKFPCILLKKIIQNIKIKKFKGFKELCKRSLIKIMYLNRNFPDNS